MITQYNAQFARIMAVVDTFANKAETLIYTATSNQAERYMHFVEKFVGDKTMNRYQRDRYLYRC
jgi:hypothetical protein